MAACTADSRPMVITAHNSTDIFSPSFPRNYPDNLNCEWKIVTDHKQNIGVEVSLKGYEIEEKYDSLLKIINCLWVIFARL